MKKNLYELDLSDEHMEHVWRFYRLGKFDRRRWQIMRGYIAWMRSRFAHSASAAPEPPQPKSQPPQQEEEPQR
jgi:hypothetical protein